MENKKKKFIKSFIPYSTYILIAGAVVLVETVPGLRYDKNEQNQFYTNIIVENHNDMKNINLELQKLNEFNDIEIMTLNGNITLNPNDIEEISYLNGNEEIVISMEESLTYYVGSFDYDQECYIFEEYECQNSKNEIPQYILTHTKW